jgi:hypothetical protein
MNKISISISVFLLCFIIVACNSNNTHKKQSITISKQETKDTFSIYGLWTLTSYFDSILAYKTISKHRIKPQPWFAMMLEIKEDSITTYGTIYTKNTYAIKSLNDTLCILERTPDGKWFIMVDKNNYIYLKQFPNSDKYSKINDSSIYTFKKRDDLMFLLDDLSNKTDYEFPYYLGKNFESFFNKELLSGRYTDTNGKEVLLNQSSEISGFENFYKYEVDPYFGTSHWLSNHDNVIFYRDSTKSKNIFDSETYVWKFIGDTLILNKVIYEIFKVNGQLVRDPELWKIDKKEIKLIKINQ